MSTRKHSATTPLRAATVTRPRLARVAGWLIAGSLAFGILAGCAEGTSQDAERGKALDAQRTSVVDDLQATESARLLAPGTPPATATQAP